MKTKMKIPVLLFAILFSTTLCTAADIPPDKYLTSFQTGTGWMPELHIPSDVVMAYGASGDNIESWAEKGYTVWSMFGASWLGKDEKIVLDNPQIVQVGPDGKPFEMIPGRAWVVPVAPWIRHSQETAGRVIAAGARGILPEEPEFFAVNGYSEAFKEEWKEFYAEEWQRPDSSPSALWKSNKLKAALFAEYYRRLFGYVKSIDTEIVCLVPAHSNLNYADWGIVAPHFSFLALLQTDGMVAQAWTGTAKGAHPLAGRPVRDAFSYSFLEYSYFRYLTYGTGKLLYLLTDPVEDAPGATWDLLKGWYEDTLISALLQPDVNRYETTPWPNRILMSNGLYGGAEQPTVPQSYATELFTVWAAQRMIPKYVSSQESGTTAIGMLTADSLMWQTGGAESRFNGHLAPMMSLMRRGIPVAVIPAERLIAANYPPKDIRLIIASFDAWKPATPGYVDGILRWIENGGTLVFLGGTDEFDNVDTNWWAMSNVESPAEFFVSKMKNKIVKRRSFISKKIPGASILNVTSARRSLKTTDAAPAAIGAFSTVAVPTPVTAWQIDGVDTWMTAEGLPVVWTAKYGKGTLVYAGFPGEAVSQTQEGERLFIELIKAAAAITPDMEYKESDHILMKRGPFVIARAIKGPLSIDGVFADLLNPLEPVKKKIEVPEGGNVFAMDIEKASTCRKGAKACLMLAGGTTFGEKEEKNIYEFRFSGPIGRNGAAWVHVPGGIAPKNVKFFVPGKNAKADSNIIADWDADAKVLKLLVPLCPDGTFVKLIF